MVGPLSSGDGKVILYEGYGTLAAMEVRYDVAVVAGFVGVFLQMDATFQNGYVIIQDVAGTPNGTWKVYVKNSGSYTNIGNFNGSGLSGNLSVRARFKSGIVYFRVWNYGTTEPNIWTYQISDSSVTNQGYAGFYNQFSGASGGSVVDNFTLDDTNTTAATDFTFTPSSRTTAPSVATGNYTITPNGVPSSSTTVALSDGGAGGTFSPTSLTFTNSIAQTFTYIPASGVGGSTKTLTATASGGFSATHTTACVVVSISVLPSLVTEGSGPNGLVITGIGTSFLGAPFTVSAGTIDSTTIVSTTSADITYTPPGTTGTITLTDTGSGAATTITIQAASASNFTLTPTSATTFPNVATGNYTVTLNGALPSTSETIALSDGGAGGTFSPTSLTFTTANASTPQTFSYIPTSGTAGTTKTLMATGSGYFSASHTASCIVSNSITILVTNSSLFWSPGNWDHLTSGTFGVSVDTMQATAAGAYLKFQVTGTINLAVGIDNLMTSGFPSGDMPIMRYSINGASWVDVQLGPSQTSLVLSTSLSPGSVYSVEIYFKASSSSNGYADVWGSGGISPTNVVRINGLTLDSGGSVSAATLRSKRSFHFGDSMLAGEHCNPDGSDDSTQSWVPLIAQALNCEYGQIGYGGQGWEVTGGSNAAPFNTAYDFYSAGRSRGGFSGLDYIFIHHGANDERGSVSGTSIQSDCHTMLTNLRTLCGSGTVMFIVVPPQGSYASNLAAAVTTYKTGSGDAKVFCLDVTSQFPSTAFTLTFGGLTEWTYDGVHPLIFGHARLAAAYSAKALFSVAGSPTTTPTNQSHQLKRARS